MPASTNGVQRAFAAANHALGPDRAVELVLDLQQAGGELVVVAAWVADADLLVRRERPRQRLVKRRGVALEVVVAHRELRLRVALVAQPPHAQRGGVRQVQGVRRQRLQAVLAAVDEARAHRRRSAVQHQQHERMTPEVSDQREVFVVAQTGQRPVVVDARDGLHAPAVAVRQAHAVDALGAADVGGAVAPDRNRLVGRQAARHAGHPQHLVAGVAQHAGHILVDLRQLLLAAAHVEVRAGDQLELRLAVIGGDARVRQRRAERRRVRRQRQRAARRDAQALLLDAAAHAVQPLRRDAGEPIDD